MLCFGASTIVFLLASQSFAQQAEEDRLVMELAKRLPDLDLATAPPKVKAAFARNVAQNRGTASYFDSVDRYKIAEEIPHLLKLVVEQPKSQEAAAASKSLLSLKADAEIRKTAAGLPAEKLPDFLEAVAKSNKREAGELLLSMLGEGSPESKSAAVKALGKSRNAENALLKAIQANAVPAEMKFQAVQVLHSSADPNTKAAIEALVPMPKSQDNKPLPLLADLVKRTGHADKGKEVYTKYCIACHQVGTTGIDFGPALTEIGTKLAKEAIYQSILEPSSGISFGFEGWEIKTKAGDAYLGMVAGETTDDLSIKAPGGVIVNIAKKDLAEKKALTISLMPPGLASAMAEQDLVDLVEYLASLKKK
jgi:putative heme-binding domain-containing protein